MQFIAKVKILILYLLTKIHPTYYILLFCVVLLPLLMNPFNFYTILFYIIFLKNPQLKRHLEENFKINFNFICNKIIINFKNNIE